MVLTNFECWAYGGTDGRGGSMFADSVIERRTIPSSVDLFSPSALQSCGHVDNSNNKIVSHLSSNGYYGFVPVAANVDNSTSDDAIKKQQQTDDNTTTTNNKHATFYTEDMDVEQHSLNDSYNTSRNFSPHFWIENFDLRSCQGRKRTHDDNNGCSIDRRKRLVAEEDILEARKRAKRCRFDSHREHIFANNNNGGCISSLPCGETNNAIQLNMDQSATDSLTVHPDSPSSIIPGVEEQQLAQVPIPAAVAVISAETVSNNKRILNTNTKINEKLSTNNFIQKAHLKTVPKTLCEENDSCHHRNNFSDVCNNLPNKLKDDGDRHIDRDCDDDQLGNLFLHLHGGNDYYLRRQLEDDNYYCEDI